MDDAGHGNYHHTDYSPQKNTRKTKEEGNFDMSEIPDILKKIIDSKKDEIASAKSSLADFKLKIKDISPALDFAAALLPGKRPALIAEVKKASPSAGIIAMDFDPVQIATNYFDTGCDAISVLTEKKHFLGDLSFIPAIKKKVGIPVLRKDFIVDSSQIYESRASGADSFLLIASALDKTALRDFISIGRELGMEPLVEIHNEEELEIALDTSARVIGVNSRDLRTFKVDIGVAMRLVALIPKPLAKIAESGIRNIETAEQLFNAGFTGFLIGEMLMLDLAGTAGMVKQIKNIRKL